MKKLLPQNESAKKWQEDLLATERPTRQAQILDAHDTTQAHIPARIAYL